MAAVYGISTAMFSVSHWGAHQQSLGKIDEGNTPADEERRCISRWSILPQPSCGPATSHGRNPVAHAKIHGYGTAERYETSTKRSRRRIIESAKEFEHNRSSDQLLRFLLTSQFSLASVLRKYKGAMISNYRHFFVVIFLCLASSLEALAQGEVPRIDESHVELMVDLDGDPASSSVRFKFVRHEYSSESLVMTTLSLPGAQLHRGVGRIETTTLRDFASHLTGWFVVKQESEELWIGVPFKAGQQEGEIEIVVPRLLESNPQDVNRFEYSFIPPSHDLPRILANSTKVQYAPIKQISVRQPSWGTILLDRSDGWVRSGRDIYSLSFGLEFTKLSSLYMQREPNFVADWLNTAFGKFFWGLAGAMLMLTVLNGVVRHQAFKAICVLIVVSVLVLLFAISGSIWPPNIRAMLFDGAIILGVFFPALVFASLPESQIANLTDFVKQLRTASSATTPPANESATD